MHVYCLGSLPPRGARCVSIVRVSFAQQLFGSAGRIPAGLVFDLCVELGAGKDHDESKPQPDEEADNRAQGSVGSVVIGEVAQVEREQPRDDEP